MYMISLIRCVGKVFFYKKNGYSQGYQGENHGAVGFGPLTKAVDPPDKHKQNGHQQHLPDFNTQVEGQ